MVDELIWRDFTSTSCTFPHSMKDAFRPQYDLVPWRHDDAHFERWTGQTGYPCSMPACESCLPRLHAQPRENGGGLVLLQTPALGLATGGTALCRLLDFELASNVGGWQWAAGSGCDAAPYFRVFNPTSQLQKFDRKYEYVKQWVPEWGTAAYPDPIVDHKMARQRAIDTYKAALSAAS